MQPDAAEPKIRRFLHHARPHASVLGGRVRIFPASREIARISDLSLLSPIRNAAKALQPRALAPTSSRCRALLRTLSCPAACSAFITSETELCLSFARPRTLVWIWSSRCVFRDARLLPCTRLCLCDTLTLHAQVPMFCQVCLCSVLPGLHARCWWSDRLPGTVAS